MKRAPLTGLELERSVRAQLYGERGQVVATGAPAVRDDPRRAGLGRALAGRYSVIELLGASGMAAVYRARDERLGRQVAVKVVAAGLAQDAVAVRRFRREAELGARLMHANIVTVLDAGVEPQDFIAMELVDGVDAGTLVHRTGPLTLHHAIRIVAPVADALQYAHEHGVIHGDVAGSSILLRQRDGVPKLTDFGVVCRDGHDIAPELLDGAAPSARSDLYSLAAVAHGLLAGPGDSRPDRPHTVTDAIEQALSPDPDARQRSVAEFRVQLTGERLEPLVLPSAA